VSGPAARRPPHLSRHGRPYRSTRAPSAPLHTGWREAGVVAEGLRFNDPVRWSSSTGLRGSFAAVDDPNRVLDTVKLAEDTDALVLRLPEAHGRRARDVERAPHELATVKVR
jgi:alpha-mannosidase